MKKKKFDWKLTACLVSLFISFALLIFFHSKPVVLFFSLTLLAVSLFFFARFRVNKIDEILALTDKEIDEELDKGVDADEEVLSEVYKEIAKLRKQKRSINTTFNLCAVLLFVVAIISLV